MRGRDPLGMPAQPEQWRGPPDSDRAGSFVARPLPSIWDDWVRPQQPVDVRSVLAQCDRALEGAYRRDPVELAARVSLAMPPDLEGVRAHAWAAYVTATNPRTATEETWEVAVELAHLYRCEVRAFRESVAVAARRKGQ